MQAMSFSFSEQTNVTTLGSIYRCEIPVNDLTLAGLILQAISFIDSNAQPCFSSDLILQQVRVEDTHKSSRSVYGMYRVDWSYHYDMLRVKLVQCETEYTLGECVVYYKVG